MAAPQTPQLIESSVTIASTTVSGVLDCTQGRVVRIDVPIPWTAANMTFQVSGDNATFTDLYDASGTEYTVTVGSTSTSRSVIIPYADLIGARFLKIRSGTTGTPVDQGGSRVIRVGLLP